MDHIDLIAGSITGMKEPGSAEYTKASNESPRVIATFTADDWEAEGEYNVIRYKINRLRNDMYFRLRGTNLPPNTTCETDPAGNPLPDSAASACYDGLDGAEEAW